MNPSLANTISDEYMEHHMNMYVKLMERKFQEIKSKRIQLEKLINSSAIKIQRLFRRNRMKKRNQAACKIQKWWRNTLEVMRDRQIKISRFRSLFYGLKIYWFLNKKKGQQIKNNTHQHNIQQHKCKPILQNISLFYNPMITKKSAMLAQHQYINKYRQYLKNKFNQDWQQYQNKITKQMWKQINKKWVAVDGKNKNKKTGKIYINQNEKQVDAEKYISTKLDAIYNEFHHKMHQQDLDLQASQERIMAGVRYIGQMYQYRLLHFTKFQH